MTPVSVSTNGRNLKFKLDQRLSEDEKEKKSKIFSRSHLHVCLSFAIAFCSGKVTLNDKL